MRTGIKRAGSSVWGKRSARALAHAAERAVEVLEERRLLTSYHVNFTAGPNSSATVTNPPVAVAGYMMDIGQAYGDRADRGNSGISYGWEDYTTGAPKNNETNGRRRNSAASGGELQDTFNHMMKPDDNTQSGWATWEIAVPNGQYQVHIVSGDITATNSVFKINAESTLVVNGTPTAASNQSHFVEGTAIVTVADNKLTIRNATGASNNKINYIDILDSFTIPPPTEAPALSVSQVGNNAVLTWNGVSAATTYNIFRGTVAGSETLLQAGVATTTFNDPISANSYYYYVVPANSQGTGPQSNEAFIAPSAPFQSPTLSVVPASGKVSLAWTPDPVAAGFDIYRGSASGNETLVKSGATGSSYNDTTVTIGNTYFYYIIPKNTIGPGPQSNEVSTDTHAAYAHINFQTPSTTTPSGYLPDVGSAYGDRGNTFSYGWWNSPNFTTNAVAAGNPAVRERGNVLSPDTRYDTFDHFHNAGSGSLAGNNWWEIAVPNGTYQVRVVSGDATASDSFFSIFAEATKDPTTGQPFNDGSGVPLLQQAPATAGLGLWVDSGFMTVVVTDGNLTISEGPGAANSKIDFIDIDTTNVVSIPADPTLASITNTHASNLTLNWTDNSTNETGFRIEQSTDGTSFTPLTTVPAHTGTGATSFVVAGLTPSTKYYYRVYATNLQGDSANPTGTVNTTTLAATGGVAGRITPTTGDFNLTTEGALDWAHWGLTNANTFDHKSTGGSLISDVTLVSSSTKVQIGGSPTTFTWSDGTANATANATGNELGTFAYGHGFSFTVPADTTSRVLRIYLGVNNVRGQLTARLSDGSAPDFVDSSLFNAAAADGVYSLAYSAASAGQTMTVSWVEIPPNGDQVGGRLNLKAATLQLAPAGVPVGTTTLTESSLTSGRNFLSWNGPITNGWGYKVERAPDAAGVQGTFATLATLDYPRISYIDGTAVAGTKYYYRVTPFNLLGQNGTVSNVASGTTATGPFGDGAQATYFTYSSAPPLVNDPYVGNVWPTTSVDQTINFDWGAGAPAGAGTGFQTDNFMTHWTFKIKPEFTETYTFYADTDDGYRLVVNGKQILNGLSRRGGVGTQFASTPIALVAGQTYDVIFDQIEVGGNAGAKLSWSSPSLPKEIVPQVVMYHTAPDTTAPKVTGIDVDGAIPAAFTYTPAEHLVIHFSKTVAGSQNGINVTVASTDFSTQYSGSQVDMHFDVASNTALITFPGAPTTVFPDNNYTIIIDAGSVSDFAGNLLDGNGDGSSGDSFNGTFYTLTGDTQVRGNGTNNSDRKVDFIDFQRVELGFGKVAADRPTAADGDFNHDGVVDRLDLEIFNQQINKTMPPPPAPAPTPAPVPVSRPVSSPAPAPVGVSSGTTKTTTPVTTKPAPKPLPAVAKPIIVAKPVVPPKPVIVVKPVTVIKPVTPPPTAFSAKRVRDWLSET